ncbi:MAG: preprotein translocase subunit Sec61beta [Candidatus Geothermarchaeales archaeon]
MSRRRDRREAPMPAVTAGLLRFFEDSTAGIKIQPVHVVGFCIIFIAISALLLIFPVIP